jgi:type IV pilus assembly protein PilE
MMEIATRQHQYFAANRAFATATELGFTVPPEVDEHYDLGITPNGGRPPGFTITMTPTGRQATDGTLTLTSAGVRSPAGKW